MVERSLRGVTLVDEVKGRLKARGRAVRREQQRLCIAGRPPSSLR